MRLSDLTRLCAERGEDNPVILLEDRDGMPVDPADVDFGVVLTDLGPSGYVLLSLQGED